MKPLKTTHKTALSLGIHVMYALYNGGIGVVTRSWWFVTLSAYYLLLSVMRFAALQMQKKQTDPATAVFAKRFTGVLFILLAVCLAGTVILATVTDRGIRYHEIVMITIALYAFTKVTLSIISLCRSKADPSPIHKILRNISFADALVSIFSLQRSMLVSFEGMSGENIRLFNALTGSAVCVAVLILGINLIGGKNVTMAKSKLAQATEKIAENVVGGYKKIEKGVVDGYAKIEKGVVDGYTKIEDKFVDQYLTRDGETVEDAKKRLKNNGKDK